jgi:hypothetical protein
MNRRIVLSLSVISALGLAFLPGSAVAQQAADIEGVKAASKAFYVALATLDNGEAMEKVWAHTPYVTYVGPRAKTIIVGWDAQKKYWLDRGGTAKMKDGKDASPDFIVTNVYEKIDGRWLIVSHHVQPKPQ